MIRFIRLCCLLGLVSLLRGQPPSSSRPASIHDFDFWVGNWEVTANGKVAGWNRVETLLDGRVVQENYTTPGAYAGHSYNSYNAPAQRWEQFWVDNSGLVLHLVGGLNPDGQMVLVGDRPDGAGGTVRDRITWTAQTDGAVRQFWETSTDGGTTWTVAFDGWYRRLESVPSTAPAKP